MNDCQICSGATHKYRIISGIDYYECLSCGSLFADFKQIKETLTHNNFEYDASYWSSECIAAKERSYGSSLQRVAEVFFYCRRPIETFIDIGSGPGYLLDALSILLPESKNKFYGIEMFPPKQSFRTNNPNYIIGELKDLDKKFDAGICMEVVEHLNPKQLSNLALSLSLKSKPDSIYFFNSGQPDFVKNEDPNYLDPLVRGHIASYSIEAIKLVFEKHGFRIIPLYGRNWAFLAEYKPSTKITIGCIDELMQRIWAPNSENIDALRDKEFGPLMYSIGLESARCYLEAALVQERTRWALSLAR